MIAFTRICDDPEATDAYLAARQFKTIPFCNACDKAMIPRADRNEIYRCTTCKKSKSAFDGVVFEDCRKGRGTFLLAAYMFIGENNAKQIMRETLLLVFIPILLKVPGR